MYRITFSLFILWVFQVPASAQKLVVPSEVFQEVKEVFEEKISYSDLKITSNMVQNNMSALKKIQNSKSKFAVIRADVLYDVSHRSDRHEGLQSSYIVLSKLPYRAQLYLLQNKNASEIYLDELKHKKVSIGVLGNGNSQILKHVLSMYGISFYVDYTALNVKDSLEEISTGRVDAFFGFLREFKQYQAYNTQTVFSKRTVDYLKADAKGLEVGDYEIHVPYLLVASKNTSDEEIENVIYRLKKKKLFSPITDTKYGMIDLYLVQHLREVEMTIAREQYSKIVVPKVTTACKEYHYGFLRLLRRKPSIKKVLKKIKRVRPSYYKKGALLLKDINEILIQIDAKRDSCDMQFLKDEKRRFVNVERKVKALLHLGKPRE